MNGPLQARPHVTVHYAQTLDGRIATRTGQSQWIGGDRSLRLAHELRAAHQAVLIGIGTLLADNPRLTVRLVPGVSPLRVVADSTLRIPLDANVLTDGAAPTLVATTARAPAERMRAVAAAGVETFVAAQDGAGRVDLSDVLSHLAARGVGALLVEGGGHIVTSMLDGRLVDRLVVCIAPRVLGAGIEAVGDLRIVHLSEAVTFSQARFTPVGEDIIFDGQIERGPPRSGGRANPHGDERLVSTRARRRAAPGADPAGGA